MSITSKRIVFFSTGEFGIQTLETMASRNHNIVGIVTNDNPSIKLIAIRYGIPIFFVAHADDLIKDDLEKWLRNLSPDFFCVISFKKLPEKLLSIPRVFPVNIHASQLPFLRGAAPINWAIRYGFKKTGLTAFVMNKNIDKGDILDMISVPIKKDDNFGTLFDSLSKRCVEFTCNLFEEKLYDIHGIIRYAQPDNGLPDACWSAPKIDKDYFMGWRQMSAKAIVNLVKSVAPKDGLIATMKLEEYGHLVGQKTVKIYDVEAVNTHNKSDYYKEIITDRKSYIHIPTSASECISIKELQLDGKKRMYVADFLRGFKYARNENFDFYFSERNADA